MTALYFLFAEDDSTFLSCLFMVMISVSLPWSFSSEQTSAGVQVRPCVTNVLARGPWN